MSITTGTAKNSAKHTYLWIGLTTFTLITLSDILVRFTPSVGKLGAMWWLYGIALLISYAVYCFFRLIQLTVRNKTPAALLVTGLLIVFVMANLAQAKSVSGETTSEIACTLRQLHSDPGWGFGETCFLGYPTRQYIAPALPSLLFGRSLISLHAGGALYFLIGILIFTHGILISIPNKRYADLLAACCLGSLLHFYFIHHALYLYEQSIYPLSFALMLTGTILHYETTREPGIFVPLGMVTVLLIFSYTPSLTLVPLFMLYLIKTGTDTRRSLFSRKLAISLIILTIIELAFSAALRRDIQLHAPYPDGMRGFIRDIGIVTEHFGLHTLPYAFTSPVFAGIFILLIVIPVSGIAGRIPFIIGVWTLVTLCASILAKGFAFYSIEFRIQRFIVVIPVIFAGLVWTARHFDSKLRITLLLCITIVILAFGIPYHLRLQKNRRTNTQYVFIQWLIPKLHRPDETVWFLYHSYDFYDLVSIHDTMQYFLPDIKTTVDYKQELSTESCIYTQTPGIIILPVDTACAEKYAYASEADRRLIPLGTFSFEDGRKLLAFRYEQK